MSRPPPPNPPPRAPRQPLRQPNRTKTREDSALIQRSQFHGSILAGRRPSAARGNPMKTRAAISALAALPTVLALAQPALAQDQDGARRFHVEASVRVGHDTNVAKSSKESARLAGINPADTV